MSAMPLYEYGTITSTTVFETLKAIDNIMMKEVSPCIYITAWIVLNQASAAANHMHRHRKQYHLVGGGWLNW